MQPSRLRWTPRKGSKYTPPVVEKPQHKPAPVRLVKKNAPPTPPPSLAFHWRERLELAKRETAGHWIA